MSKSASFKNERERIKREKREAKLRKRKAKHGHLAT
jgi:hypothetical protein